MDEEASLTERIEKEESPRYWENGDSSTFVTPEKEASDRNTKDQSSIENRSIGACIIGMMETKRNLYKPISW